MKKFMPTTPGLINLAQKMKKLNKKLQNTVIKSEHDDVTIYMDGSLNIRNIEIEDKELAGKLIIAFQKAIKKQKEIIKEELEGFEEFNNFFR